MTTATPASASANAHALPRPWLDAQTIALRPRIFRSMSYLLRARRARVDVARTARADFCRGGPGRVPGLLVAGLFVPGLGGGGAAARSGGAAAASAAKVPREAFNAVASAASPLTRSPQRSSCPLRLPLSVNFNPSGDTARMKVLPPR